MTRALVDSFEAMNRAGPCAVARSCGGCPHIAVSAEQQAVRHRERIAEQLTRAGVPVVSSCIEWLTTGQRFGYRNRIRLRVERGRPCFFNSEKDPECVVLDPRLRDSMRQLEDWARRDNDALLLYEHLELRAPDALGRGGLVLVPAPDAKLLSWMPVPQLDASSERPFPLELLVWVRGVGVPPVQRVQLPGGVFSYVPLGSFVQVHSRANWRMVEWVRRRVLACGARTVADVFSGSGNFGLPLLRAGLSVGGVEVDSYAVDALHCAAREQGLDATHFVAEDATEWLTRQARAGEQYDCVIVDPPRAGLKQGVNAVCALSRDHLLLCTCRLATLSRDAAEIRARGFVLEAVCAVDMFPNTDHVETLAWFRRR